MHNRLPGIDELLDVDPGVTDRADGFRSCRAAGDEQVPVLQGLQAWAQIEAEQASQRHRDVGMAVRIDG
jgi:hypothetical protein